MFFHSINIADFLKKITKIHPTKEEFFFKFGCFENYFVNARGF